MRRDSSILPRSSRFRKMFRAGGQVPAHTVAPASASALAMAKPYPPSSATPATNARLPFRSMLSIPPPKNSERGSRNAEQAGAFRSAFRVPTSALNEKPRRHRNQLRVPDECMREDPTQRPLLRGDRVRGAREGVEKLVIQILERPLEPIILEVIVPQQLHPLGVIRR